MDCNLVNPEKWNSGVWYDMRNGQYFTIEFDSEGIHLIYIPEETPNAIYTREADFLRAAELFHRIDPQATANPVRVVQNALSELRYPDPHENIELHYALEVTEITKRDEQSVSRDAVEEAVVGALDEAYDEIPPDGRLPREKAKSAVVDAIDSVAQE